ncbi:thioredoxin family protein [Planomicrobium sp. Y74]|uniref:thioredoxin family protein n=1 Tax=Planomicrobium sp. Y74 TaxID=2478977 RepID=UPI000EF4D147|nr:thioredoxin family protein [Planomicrobium sp. Y74]RLQ92174.1 thioredoxin [Planomicrobium sp. Y74]
MKTINTMNEYRQLTSSAETFLLFVKTDNCSVCEGLRPQIELFEDDYEIPFYLVNGAKLPELAGELLLFSAPIVLMFHEGSEIHRFVRFIRIDELRIRLDELEEGLDV